MPITIPPISTALHALTAGPSPYPRYSARAILLTTLNAGSPAAVLSTLSELAYRGEPSPKKQPAVFGHALVLSPFVVVHVEGDYDGVVDYLKELQPLVKRWPGLEPHHPIMQAIRRRDRRFKAIGQPIPQSLLGVCAVLLFEEDISLHVNNWRVALIPALSEGEANTDQSFSAIVARVVASLLRCATLLQLSGVDAVETTIPHTDLSAGPSQLLLKLSNELPKFAELRRLLGEAVTPSTSSGGPEPWQVFNGRLSIETGAFYIDSLKGDALERLQAIEDRRKRFLAEEETIFAIAANVDPTEEELFSLDEFITTFIYATPDPLFDEAYSMNENWCYDNLRHLIKPE